MSRVDLTALQQRLAQQQPKPPIPVLTEPPSGTLRATTAMRASLPLKATTNTRADRAEERAMVKALRAQIDELNAEMAVASAEAERALAEERQRADRLNKQVEALSAEVEGAKKQAGCRRPNRTGGGGQGRRARRGGRPAHHHRRTEGRSGADDRHAHPRACRGTAGRPGRTA